MLDAAVETRPGVVEHMLATWIDGDCDGAQRRPTPYATVEHVPKQHGGVPQQMRHRSRGQPGGAWVVDVTLRQLAGSMAWLWRFVPASQIDARWAMPPPIDATVSRFLWLVVVVRDTTKSRVRMASLAISVPIAHARWRAIPHASRRWHAVSPDVGPRPACRAV